MNLQNVKTKNEAIELLVKSIVNISNAGNQQKVSVMERESRFYDEASKFLKNEFKIDTTPYDNIAIKLIPLMY